MALILMTIVVSLMVESVRGSTQFVTYNTSTTIQSLNYPKPYPTGSNISWEWQAENGIWGINFIDVDLSNNNDVIVVKQDKKQPIYVDKISPRIYTTSTRVIISFYSRYTSNPTGRGFKIDVVHGMNKKNLNQYFLTVNVPPQTVPNQDMTTIAPVLLTIATIVLFMFVGVFVLFVYRRHHLAHQVVSLNVSVHNIRRDSGVRYNRQASTDSQDGHTRKNKAIVRTPSTKSWAARAELTSPTRTCAMAMGDNHQSTVPNVYASMKDAKNLTGNSDSRGVPGKYQSSRVMTTGHVSVIRDEVTVRCPTLDRIFEDGLSIMVPMTTGSTSHDDGYVEPSLQCDSNTTGEHDGYIPPFILQRTLMGCHSPSIGPSPQWTNNTYM